MKRNDLVARSLTLGLAVATAAASMSTPGGLMAPVTVLAETASTATITKMDTDQFGTWYSSWTGKPESLDGFGDYAITSGDDNTINVTGTAKYHTGFTGFNSKESGEQEGYYLAWQFEVPKENLNTNATIKWQSNGAPEGVTGENGERGYKELTGNLSEKLDTKQEGEKYYFTCLTYISPKDQTKSIKVKVDWDGTGTDSTETTYTIDYSALKFEIPGTATIKQGDSALSAAPEVGDELTAAITDLDSTFSAEYSYQWYRTNNSETKAIDNATSDKYTVADADLGATISVKIAVSGNASYNELESTKTGTVVDTKAPTLSEIAAPVNEKLTANSAKISIQSTEAGKAYYVVKEEADATITSASVKGQGTSVDIQAATSKEVVISDKDSNKTYYVYVVAEDAAGNLSDVQSVTFTTQKAAFVGTLAIKTGETGESELGASLEIGTKLTATVTGENATQKNQYTYKWYRTKDAHPEFITGATTEAYTVTKDDLGAKISVEIIAADASFETKKSDETPAVAKKANEINLNAGDVFKNEPELVDGVKTLAVTVPEDVTNASRKLEYQIGTGEWVTLPDTKKIPLENKAYAANTIKVRVQATDEIKESDAVSYDQKITATLEGSVTLSTETKVGQTITATVTGAQQDATLQYQFVRVTTDGNGAENTENIGSASATNTYELKAADVGKKIKVIVTASGEDYTGSITSENTAEITKADGRTITINDVISAIEKPAVGTETYTYTMKSVSGAKYQMTAGANTAAGETWGDTNEFSGLTPGQSYTFHAIMPETTEYKAGIPISFTIDFPKLTHVPLLLDYDVTQQKVTITKPAQETANIEYTFDGGEKWVDTNEHTYDQGVKEVTIGIRYKDSDIYNAVTPITESIDLSKTETQTMPNSASIAVKTNPTKTKYQITITEPTGLQGGETMEYSLDGANYTTKPDIESKEFGANTTVTLYYRKKATETANASKAGYVGQDLYGASATPVITGAGGATTFKDSLAVTLKASGDIYYTTDGSTPTTNSTKYSDPFTINATTNVKAIAVEEGRIISEVASATFTKETTIVTPPTNDSTWTGSTTTPSTDNKKDDNKTEDKATTTTETKADGTQVTTTETKAEDGSVTAKVELKNDTTGVAATVNVAKDADGKVTDATAAVKQTSADKKAGISAATVAQITEAAGTKAVEINAEIVDESGNTVCRLTANAEDLKAGNKLKVLKYDSKTGDYVLVNKTTYKVDKDGNLAMNDLKRAKYMVVTASEAETFSKQVLKTVKVETAKKNVTAGKKTKITLDDGLNMANVAKITYKTSRKSVATVNKNGTITTKKAGTVTVRATVTLKNGKTKSVKMTLTVKKAK